MTKKIWALGLLGFILLTIHGSYALQEQRSDFFTLHSESFHRESSFPSIRWENEPLPLGGKLKIFLGRSARIAVTGGLQLVQVKNSEIGPPKEQDLFFNRATIGLLLRISKKFSLTGDVDCYSVSPGAKQRFTIPIGFQYKY